MAENSSNSGSSNSPTSGNNPLRDSPFGRLVEVIPEKDLPKIFSGVGNQEGGGSPFGAPGGAGGSAGGGGSQPDLPYGGNPFAGDNFWNIFAGGVNPSNPSAGGGGSSPAGGNPFAGGGSSPAGGGNQSSGRDPLTGASSQTDGISTTEIPDGFTLGATIHKLIDSRLDKELGSGQTPSFGGGQGQTPSFGGGQGQTPSFGGSGQNPSSGGTQIPSFGGNEIPAFGGGQIPSFGAGQAPSFGGQ